MDNFRRVYFHEKPFDVCKAIVVGNLIFLSGMEGINFKENNGISDDVFEQIEVVVDKMNDTLRELGLSVANMIKHTIYLKKDVAEPKAIIRKFHDECLRHAPDMPKQASVGTLVLVEGLAIEVLKIEVDSIAAYPNGTVPGAC